MLLKKESKIRVLENFYSIDYIFFGKPLSKVDSCCPLVKEEYLSVKGALLSVFIEMLQIVKHEPKTITEKIESGNIFNSAKKVAKEARINAKNIVSSNKSRANIKFELKEALEKDNKIDTTTFIEEKIRTRAFEMAIDNLIIARTINESADYQKLNEWSGQIIEDSYKVLRESLVESALSILYDTETD